MNAKRRKKIKKALLAIANGAVYHMPLWTIIDNYTCELMRDAAEAIEYLEKKQSK